LGYCITVCETPLIWKSLLYNIARYFIFLLALFYTIAQFILLSVTYSNPLWWKGFRWFPWRGRQCQDKEGGVSKHGAFALSQARVYWTQIPWIWCQHSDTAKAFAGHLCTKEFNKVHQYEISVRDVLSYIIYIDTHTHYFEMDCLL